MKEDKITRNFLQAAYDVLTGQSSTFHEQAKEEYYEMWLNDEFVLEEAQHEELNDLFEQFENNEISEQQLDELVGSILKTGAKVAGRLAAKGAKKAGSLAAKGAKKVIKKTGSLAAKGAKAGAKKAGSLAAKGAKKVVKRLSTQGRLDAAKKKLSSIKKKKSQTSQLKKVKSAIKKAKTT